MILIMILLKQFVRFDNRITVNQNLQEDANYSSEFDVAKKETKGESISSR